MVELETGREIPGVKITGKITDFGLSSILGKEFRIMSSQTTSAIRWRGPELAKIDDGDDKEDSETAANEVSQEKVTKKRKRIEDTPSTTVPEDDDAKTDHVGESKRKKTKKDSDENEDSKSKARYILFVGNLKYTTSKEAIQDHFSVCGKPRIKLHSSLSFIFTFHLHFCCYFLC